MTSDPFTLKIRQPRAEKPTGKTSIDRTTAKYLAMLALTTGLFFWKTLLTNQFTRIIGSEAVNYTYSWLHFWINSLWHGRVPLWDPYAFCGRPFAGEMLPSAYYPLHLLFLLVPFNRNGLVSPRLCHEYFALTHLLCAYFTFALIRELHLSRFAAFAGACCFSLSVILVGMNWLPFLEAGIWLPAIFLFLLRALRAEPARNAILEASLSGLCLGLSILTGGLHFSIMQGIVVVTAVIYYGISTPALSVRSRWFRPAIILAIILAVAAGAGAVQLLPSYEYGRLTMRFIDGGAFPATQKIPYHRLHPGMWPQSIVSPLLPAGFGTKIGGGEIWPMYIGVLPFFLAITAIWKCWGNLWVRYLTGLTVMAFLYSLGEYSPVHGVLYAVVPFLWVVRVASRFVYLASFALAILAAFGMDRILDPANQSASWNSSRPILKWVAIACAAALFVSGIFGQLNLDIWTSFSLLLIAASCGFFGYLTTRPAGPWVRFLVAVFIVFDLNAFNWGQANIDQPSKPHAQMEQLISLRGVADFLKARRELGRVRVAVSPEPNIGDAYEVQSVWGGGGTMLTDYSRLVPNHEDLLNVRHFVRPASIADPRVPEYSDRGWNVYEDPKAYPRAWVVHEVAVERSHDAVFHRIDDPAINLHKVAVIEAPLAQSLGPASTKVEPVRFRSYEADRILLDVTAESPGLLILSELYYPGWRATVNGRPTEIHKVNGALRGILVPRGESRIAVEYAPFSFYAGGALSLLTFTGVLTAFVVSLRKRFREGLRPNLRQAP
ncbi:MAG TPA: YfhO family protein [Bryobacteraceae bacterium]|nr:YfhO family protein [Bryobacteraceae bacterium]